MTITQPDQLDLFAHSRDVMLRNDVLSALEQHDAGAARAARARLAGEFPDDAALAPIDELIAAVPADDAPPWREAGEGLEAWRRVTASVEPAAQRLFGAAAGQRWVQPLWRDLARRAAPLRYDAAQPEVHAAPLWLRAGDPERAIAAVDAIESWRRKPAPLAWMAEARCRAYGLEAGLALLAELAWLATPRFDDLARRLADPLLERWLARFDSSFEVDARGRAWFPAWTLTQNPKLAAPLELTQRSLDTPPEQATRLLLELLRLERQGRHHEIIERRRALRGLSEALFGAYMATR